MTWTLCKILLGSRCPLQCVWTTLPKSINSAVFAKPRLKSLQMTKDSPINAHTPTIYYGKFQPAVSTMAIFMALHSILERLHNRSFTTELYYRRSYEFKHYTVGQKKRGHKKTKASWWCAHCTYQKTPLGAKWHLVVNQFLLYHPLLLCSFHLSTNKFYPIISNLNMKYFRRACKVTSVYCFFLHRQTRW